MGIEAIFHSIGYRGKYQKRLGALLVLSTIPNGLIIMVMVFTHETPPHRCYIPEIDNQTLAEAYPRQINETSVLDHIPMELKDGKEMLSQCKMYWMPMDSKGNLSSIYNANDSAKISGCRYGMHYDMEDGKETIVTKWDLVCDRAWIKPLATSSYMIGVVISSVVTGDLSDRFGRRLAFLWATYLQFIFTAICALSTNVIMYAITLAVSGGFGLTNMATAVVFVSEVFDPKTRSVLGNLEMMGFAAGYMILPLVAYLALNWRYILLALSAPIILFIPYWWLIFESPRWLVQKGRDKEAKKILMKMAKINRTWTKETEENLNKANLLEEKKDETMERTMEQYNYIDIFRYSKIRTGVLICSYSWIILNLTYYFFSYNTGNLGGNSYINCFLAAVVEIPAAIMSIFLMNKIGRSLSYIILMSLGAFSCLGIPFLLDLSPAAGISLAMFGKFILTAAFDIFYLYTSEIFPTLMRYKAFGIASCMGRIGGFSAPYLVYWGENINKYMPYMLMFGLSLLNALLTFLLPETMNVPVPDTVEDAEEMKTLINIKCWNSKERMVTEKKLNGLQLTSKI